MVEVKHNGKSYYAVVDGKRIVGATEREMSDALYDMGYDDDEVSYPTVEASAPAALSNGDKDTLEGTYNDTTVDVGTIVVAESEKHDIMLPVEANAATQLDKEPIMLNVKFSAKYANYRTKVGTLQITATRKDKMIQRLAEHDITEDQIAWDDTELGANAVEKPRAVSKTVHDKAVVSTNEAAISIAKSEFSVKERFEFIEEFTRLCARGVIPSLILTGSGGIGKTKNVMKTLDSLHLTEDSIGEADGDFIFVKGYSTARNLYTTLFHNNGKIIIFDDCDTAFKDPISSNILKGALDSNGKRIITWGAESRDESVPSRFEFFGKVIFISNLPLVKFPQALLSRSMLVDLTLNGEEMVDRIEQVFAEETEYEDDDKVAALDFIKRNAAKFKDLNVRSAFNALKMKVAIGDNWEKMALYSATVN